MAASPTEVGRSGMTQKALPISIRLVLSDNRYVLVRGCSLLEHNSSAGKITVLTPPELSSFFLCSDRWIERKKSTSVYKALQSKM